MQDGDVHDARAERAGRFVGGKLVEMGQCDFPHKIENDGGNYFRFYGSEGSVASVVNLTSCAVQGRSAAVGSTGEVV